MGRKIREGEGRGKAGNSGSPLKKWRCLASSAHASLFQTFLYIYTTLEHAANNSNNKTSYIS